MRRVSLASIGVATSLALVCACGDGGGSVKPLRDVTVYDLPEMVLQPEDVPEEFTRRAGEGEGLGFATEQDIGENEGYAVEYELSPDKVRPGDIACITSGVALFASSRQADEGLGTADRLVQDFSARSLDAESEGFHVKRATRLDIGSEALGYRIESPSAAFCGLYENEPVEQISIIFTEANTVSVVTVITYESGADSEKATAYARKQEQRVASGLTGTQND